VAPIDGEVMSVTDGDTIRVTTGDDELTVRLAGINSPDQGECHFEEATTGLAARLGGAVVHLEVVGLDRFERTLAHLFVDQRHVNHEMVANGSAWVSDPGADDPYRSVLLDAEQRAFDSGVGLWSSGACGAVLPPPDVAIDQSRSQPNPPGPDGASLGDEVVTIVNRSGEMIDIGGWTLRDTSSVHRYTFPEGTSLGSGEIFDVDSAAPGWRPGGSPVWNNRGDMAVLVDTSGRVISRWRY
jgi:micrococcal nuclease